MSRHSVGVTRVPPPRRLTAAARTWMASASAYPTALEKTRTASIRLMVKRRGRAAACVPDYQIAGARSLLYPNMGLGFGV
jgi:hypothetical protein